MSPCPRKRLKMSPASFSPKLDTAFLHGSPRARLPERKKADGGGERRQPANSRPRLVLYTDCHQPTECVIQITRERLHSLPCAFSSALSFQLQKPIVLAGDRPFSFADTASPSKYQRRPWQALYGEKEWKEGRTDFLRSNPLCAYCLRYGIRGRPAPQYTAACVVDHIKRHMGDRVLFYDRSNWQPLCQYHHDKVKQTQERRSEQPTYGEDGWPQ